MPDGAACSVLQGDRICRRMTRHYARTFYFASHCLPRDARRHAYAIYAFCRWADNAVDDATDLTEAHQRLDHARHVLEQVYGPASLPPPAMAFRRAVEECRIPGSHFEDLLDGMAMDLSIRRYETWNDLELYCYRVAGVVGLMMTHVFGFRDPACLPRAVDLGMGMQLTNILRDIREDLDRDRIYLPLEELDRFGVTTDQLAAGTVDAPFREFMQFQIDRARRYYRSAEAGIPSLVGASSRLTVRVMGRLYGGILDEVEKLDYHVFAHRARVSTARKLRLLAQCQAETWRESARRFWISHPHRASSPLGPSEMRAR